MRSESVGSIAKGFPAEIASEVRGVSVALPDSPYPPAGNIGPLRMRGEVIQIPHRIYQDEPDSPSPRGTIQETIVACVYTRHHDGAVRQRSLERLFPSLEYWVAPFVVQLVGEYVIEIVEVLARHAEQLRGEPYQQFVAENPEFLRLTNARMVSYWDCYYRERFPQLNEYVGTRVLEALMNKSISNGIEGPRAPGMSVA